MVTPSVRPHRLALALVAAVLTVAVLGAIVAAERQHRQTIAAEASRLATAAQVIDEHMRGVLGGIDNLLQQVISAIEHVDLAHPQIKDIERKRILAEASRLLPGAGAIFLTDAEGNLLHAPMDPVPPGVNLADRQYFQEMKAGHYGLHVGRAIPGRLLSGVFFTAGRALRDPEGGFHGVIIAAIDIAFARNFYETLDLGGAGTIGVFRQGGEGVVRHPFDERFLSILIPSETNDGFRASERGVAFHASPVDGVERLVAYREVAGYPLYVVVGKTASSILAEWREDFRGMAWLGGLFLLAMVVLVAIMLRGFRREEAAHDALQQSNDRINLTLRMVPVTLAEMDRDLRSTWMTNPLFGMASERFLGKTLADVFAEPLPEVEAARREVVRTGRPSHLQASVRRPDSGMSHLEFMIEPQTNGRGEIIGLRLAITDITERVEEKRALIDAKAAADQANQAKTRFLAAASHDLRQPLQGLRLFLDLLAIQLAGHPQHAAVDRAREALSSVERLLTALLDMSRLEAGEVKPQVAPVPILDLVAPVIKDCEATAKEKDLALRWRACSRNVLTDPVLFQRILRNLIVNAIRYTGRGGLLVGCRCRGDTARIEVWDTGSGIPADRLKLIFEEFYRMPESEAQHEGGLGLGLSIVERTARLLGHAIEVRSRPGRGTVFAITLPLAPATPVADPAVC